MILTLNFAPGHPLGLTGDSESTSFVNHSFALPNFPSSGRMAIRIAIGLRKGIYPDYPAVIPALPNSCHETPMTRRANVLACDVM